MSAGLSVGCTSSTAELPSAATSNRATATTSIFWRRSSSGRSGSGLKRARAESLPPPRPVAGGCDAASLGTAALSALSDALPCALSSGGFAGCAGGAGRTRSRRWSFGSGGFGTVTGSCGASWRAPAFGLGSSSNSSVEWCRADAGARLAPRSPAGIRGGAQTIRGWHREASTGAAAKDCPQFVHRGLENSVALDRDQEVFRSRFTRAKHRLNHDAVRGACVRGYDDVRFRPGD